MRLVRGIILLILGLFVAVNTSAQSLQLKKTDSVFRLIKKYSKIKDADAIYDLAAIRFKQSITQGTFRDYLFRELFALGPIKKDSLLSFVNNLTATYKMQMDAVTMQLTISIGDNDKLTYFKLEPFTEFVSNKSARVVSSNELKTTLDKKVDSVVRGYIQKSNTVGMSIAIFKDGQSRTYNYGETKKGNGQLPNIGSIYEVGSITKTFTATLLAWYVNEGKLSLTDPITKYLPDSVATNPSLKNIKLVNLTNHTSGLPGLPSNFTAQKAYQETNPYKNYNKGMLFSYLKNCTLRSEPGTRYAYSNLAVGLLGIILERINGKQYEQLVSDIICKPLGMNSTVQHLYPLISTRFTTVYDENGSQTPAWDFDALAACGSLRSTINDLLLYTKANMVKADTKLSKAFELTHQITFSNDTKVAMGWHIINVDGVNYYFHNGGTDGSSSFLAYNIEKNIAVIILSNSGASTDTTGVGLLKLLQ
ncbi:beta-lactamase family protein [Mucilaginibacter corticis]|uniref:Beta-lactamase family protein n=1 Tax=Mucilaginibacter corticis TaxID=2597670 RepID=A0A556MFW8_9SPHI|nr:serine hydrolase domain-containing protein [Mucilaginibacter corticis]TSJ38702.1 beta-lactamase family protein [Mucilaginibacter corticis]